MIGYKISKRIKGKNAGGKSIIQVRYVKNYFSQCVHALMWSTHLISFLPRVRGTNTDL